MNTNERQAGTHLRDDARGAVYVEFLVAFIPVLTFFLGMIQLALIFSAHLVVQHAAWRAARAAIVVLEEDPERYEGEVQTPRGKIFYDGIEQSSSDSGDRGSLTGVASQLNLPGVGALGDAANLDSSSGGPRLNAIRRAAYMPLAVLAPSLSRLAQTFRLDVGIERLGDGGRFLGGLLLYNRAAAMVTLRDPNGDVTAEVKSDEDVRVHVTYMYSCGIPLVNVFMCDSVADLTGLTRAQEAVQAVYSEIQDGDILGAIDSASLAREELRAARDDFDSFKKDLSYAQNPGLIIPFMFANGYFKIIEAETILPNQGACYYTGSSCEPPEDP